MTKTWRGSPTVTIRLKQEQINRLKQLAQERGISLSLLLREAIKLYLLSQTDLVVPDLPAALPGQIGIEEA